MKHCCFFTIWCWHRPYSCGKIAQFNCNDRHHLLCQMAAEGLLFVTASVAAAPQGLWLKNPLFPSKLPKRWPVCYLPMKKRKVERSFLVHLSSPNSVRGVGWVRRYGFGFMICNAVIAMYQSKWLKLANLWDLFTKDIKDQKPKHMFACRVPFSIPINGKINTWWFCICNAYNVCIWDWKQSCKNFQATFHLEMSFQWYPSGGTFGFCPTPSSWQRALPCRQLGGS